MNSSKTLLIFLVASALVAGCNSSSSSSSDDNGGSGSGSGSGGGDALSAFSTSTFFIGNDGSSGNTTDGSQLWKTDGTESGTSKVKAIAPGADAKMRDFTLIDGQVFFAADDGDGHGVQLWVSDGTESGTVRLTDSTDLDAGSASQLTAFQDTLYFRGRAPGDDTWIWVSDGTAGGAGVMDDDVLLENGLNHLTAFKDHLYFSADDGTNDEELWRSDGTAANTELVKNIKEDNNGIGALRSCLDGFAELDGFLYFGANDGSGTGGCALWRTNGDIGNAEKIREISSSSELGPKAMVASGNKLYFLAGGGTGEPSALWVSDGTPGGTEKAFETNDDYQVLLGSSGPTGIQTPLLAAGDYAYFHVRDKDTSDQQLWFSNGSDTGVVSEAEINDMAVNNDRLFYVDIRPDKDSDFITPNRGIWTAVGEDTDLIHTEFTGSNGGKPMFQVDDGNALLFSSMGEVWRTNGQSSGTGFVSDICPGNCFGFIGLE